MEYLCSNDEKNDSVDIDDNQFNIEEVIDLKNEIETSLTKGEYIEIFKLIRRDKVKYSENKNGIFINMKKLKPETLNEIRQLVDFTKKNKKQLENDTIEREQIKELMNKDINKEINKAIVNTSNTNSLSLNTNIIDNDGTTLSNDTNTHINRTNDDTYTLDDNNTIEDEDISFDNQDAPMLSILENELSGLNNLRFDKTKLYEKKKNICI